MKYAAKSIVGKQKKRNEDSFLIKSFNKNCLLTAVADGLGGQPAGNVASRTAIRHIELFNPTESVSENALGNLMLEADKTVTALSETDSRYNDMGTTLTLALIDQNMLFWAHVGDTRIYHLRNGFFQSITTDQTMARFLVEEDEITEHELLTHPMRNLLDQSLGCGFCEPETGVFDIENGDTILLCSDGLYSMVEGDQIKDILEMKTDPDQKVEDLVNAVMSAGGKDDITVIVVEI